MYFRICGLRFFGCGSSASSRNWTLSIRAAAFASIFSILAGCSPTPEEVIPLISQGSVPLDIVSLSGLSPGDDASTLWCVSDEPGSDLYRIRTNGEIDTVFSWSGEDLEGVAWDRTRGVLWLVEEERGELVGVDAAGAEISRTAIPGGGGSVGLEGVTVDPVTGAIFLLRERKPGLFIELDDTFAVVDSRELDFALDYSGICFEPVRKEFWILSDRERALFRTENPEGPYTKYTIEVEDPEGIAVDVVNRVIYVVGDSAKRLYYFAFPD